MEYTAEAHWEGSLKAGKGTLSTESGALKNTAYSYRARFEDGNEGTNPEELLAATHAGCFTMAVCAHLTKRGYDPVTLDTSATVTMEALAITAVHLSIRGNVKELSADEFTAVARHESQNCIISKALSVKVTCEAALV